MPKKTRHLKPHSHTVTVRLTDEEYIKLSDLAHAGRCPMATVLRAHLSKQPALKAAPPARPVFDAQALKALAQIGNNVNQIARELHGRLRQEVSAHEIESIDRALLAVIRMTLQGREKAGETLSIGLSKILQPPDLPTAETT